MDATNKTIEASREKFSSALLVHIEQLAQQKALAEKFIGGKMELTLSLTVCFEPVEKGTLANNKRPVPCCICYKYPGSDVVICHGNCCGVL